MQSIESDRDEPQEPLQPEIVPDPVFESFEKKDASKPLILAIDFGTTYSAISYVHLQPGETGEQVLSSRIKSIENYPNDMNQDRGNPMKKEAPTEVIYPLDRNFRKKANLEFGKPVREYVPPSPNGHLDEQGELSTPFEHSDHMDVDNNGDGSESGSEFSESDFLNYTTSFQWGYGVHEAWRHEDTPASEKIRLLTRFKLLLHTDPKTDQVRRDLEPAIATLCENRVLQYGCERAHVSVISDYLTCLLRHAKSELQAAGLYPGYEVEVVLCIPAIWSQQACRDMQRALARALKQANFEGVDIQQNSIDNLFVVSEPEAAAAYVLENERRIHAGSTFVLLDAGGGTVDANTYTVNQTIPQRLKAEGAPPEGGLFGSSYLNEDFRRHIRGRLKDEKYLERNDKRNAEVVDGRRRSERNNRTKRIYTRSARKKKRETSEVDEMIKTNRVTIDSIAETITSQFEYTCKRNFNIYEENPPKYKVFCCEGLRDDKRKKFKNGRIWVKFDTIKDIFLNCLREIETLMINQIEAARERGTEVDNVVLIGGFAGSVSLFRYLDKSLKEYNSRKSYHVELIVPKYDVTAVSAGAVLRALNKERGPERHARSSYGIMRSEPYGEHKEHVSAKATRNKLDGMLYVEETIDWVLKLGDVVPPVWKCAPFICCHIFPFSPDVNLQCEEVLYVSDRATESHFYRRDKKNKGAQEVGRIIADFNFLLEQGLLRPIEPEFDKEGKPLSKKHYKVQYTMYIRVVDRDLRCFAVYNGQVVKQCRINIASGFSPGVK